MKIHCSNLGPNFQKIVEDAIQNLHPVADPGVAVAVVKDGHLAFAGGFGLRDRASGAEVDACTSFAIGSATKAFTSMAIAMYIEQNKLGFDVPLQRLFPEFQMKDAQASSETTLLDILCHRTGVAPHNCLWYLGPFTRSQLLYRLRYLDPVPVTGGTAFRTTFVYNNIMYMVAGHLLEILSGADYETIIKTRILEPLDMTETSFTLADLTRGTNFAKGYEKTDPLPLKDFTNVGPAAEINSNVLDMAKWVQLFLRKGFASNGSVLLSKPNLERMYAPLICTDDGTQTSYGLGWTIGTIQSGQQKKRLVFHTGDADGYSAYVSFMPDDGLGVVVFTNQHCTPDMVNHWPDKIARDLYDHLLHDKLTGQISLPPRATPVAASGGPGDAQLAALAGTPAGATAASSPGDYAGMFSNPGYGDMVVGRSGSNLTISYYGYTWPLQPLLDKVFRFDVVAFGTDFPVVVKFFPGSTGSLDSFAATLVVEPSVLWIPFLKR
jgi:CubicO group peptidase (beta-lactamase class C family)